MSQTYIRFTAHARAPMMAVSRCPAKTAGDGFAASLWTAVRRDWPVCFVGVPTALITALLYPLFPGLNGTTSAEVFWCLVACSTLGLSHGALDALLMFRLEGGAYRVTLLLGYL